MVGFFRVLPLRIGSLTRDLVTLVVGTGRRPGHHRLVGVGPDVPHPVAPVGRTFGQEIRLPVCRCTLLDRRRVTAGARTAPRLRCSRRSSPLRHISTLASRHPRTAMETTEIDRPDRAGGARRADP